jgi:hypothetical protein
MGAEAKFWALSTERQSPLEKMQNKPPQKVRGWVDFGNRMDFFSIRQGDRWAQRGDDSVKYSVRCVLGDPVFDDNGVVDFVEDKVSSISVGRSAFTAQLCDCNDDIAMYRGCIDHAFGQKEFGLLLTGAALTIERERHTAGEVYGQDENGADLAYTRDCYTTEVVGVKLSAWSAQKIDDALTL